MGTGQKRLAVLALVLVIAAAGAAFRAGLVGRTVLDPEPLEPRERTSLAPLRAAVLDTAGRECAERTPALPSTADAWEAILGDFSWSPAPVGLSGGVAALRGFSLLVAPGSACLDDVEAEALRAFVDGGGGLVAAGRLGERRPPDGEATFELLAELLGAERFDRLVDPGGAIVALRDGSPLAAGLEALSLAPPREPRFVAVAPGPHPYWSDSRLQPLDPALPQAFQLAALTGSFGKGRVAWFGFSFEAAAGRAPATRRLLRNAASWAGGLPVVSLAPWPAPHRSAVLVRANVAGRPRNAAFVARAVLDAGVAAAFVVRPEAIAELDGLEPTLSGAGDIVLASDRAPESPLAVERLRVRRTLGEWPAGLFRAGGTEAEAAQAAAAAGLGQVLTEGSSGRGRPTVRRAVRRWGPWRRAVDVVALGRVGDDDLGLSPLGFEGLRPDWLRRRLLADYEVVAALGGLHVLSFHTHALGAPDRVDTLSWLLAEFGERGAWVAGPSDLATWWRARAGLDLEADATAPGRLRLELRAPAGLGAGGVGVDVFPPPGARAVVAPGSTGCRQGAARSGGAARLVLEAAGGARDYRCEVRFVR